MGHRLQRQMYLRGRGLRWRCRMPGRRQEPVVDLIGEAASWSAAPADRAPLFQLNEMAGHRGLWDTADFGQLADRWKTAAGMVGKSDEALKRPAQIGLERAIDVKSDGNKGQHS